MLFRGVVQEAIGERFGPWIALATASIAFGLAHPLTRTYVVLAAGIGTYLGGLWLMTHERLRHTPRVRAVMDFLAAALTKLSREAQVPEPGRWAA